MHWPALLSCRTVSKGGVGRLRRRVFTLTEILLCWVFWFWRQRRHLRARANSPWRSGGGLEGGCLQINAALVEAVRQPSRTPKTQNSGLRSQARPELAPHPALPSNTQADRTTHRPCRAGPSNAIPPFSGTGLRWPGKFLAESPSRINRPSDLVVPPRVVSEAAPMSLSTFAARLSCSRPNLRCLVSFIFLPTESVPHLLQLIPHSPL